jgi:F-actin capping protein, beta subunit
VHTTPAQKLKAALDIAATMPPSKIRKNLIGLINLAPEIEDNLMEKIDLPLCTDLVTQKSTTPTPTSPSSKPNSIAMATPIDHASPINTTPPAKATSPVHNSDA